MRFRWFGVGKWCDLICRYVMVKPDGVQRGLVGSIITRFEAKGLVRNFGIVLSLLNFRRRSLLA